MSTLNKKEAFILFLGDIIIFFISLWVALVLRYQEISFSIFHNHIIPFSIIFSIWVIVFFIAGIYDTHTTVLKGKLPTIVFHSQVINSIIAVLFFYLIPFFGITPKINLFTTLLVSFILVLFWRRYGYRLANYQKRQNAILIASGNEARELMSEINANPRYGMSIVSFIDLNAVNGDELKRKIEENITSFDAPFAIIDFGDQRINPIMQSLYGLFFSKVRFLEMHSLYENIFDRLPLSLIREDWILKNVANYPKPMYDFLKRVVDTILATFLGVVSLVLYPFVILVIMLDSKGPIFIYQDRVGQYNKIIRLIKFRTMLKSEQGTWGPKNDNKVTRVGKFLRQSRIDELPQLWNVIFGDISLIGPRPEFPEPVRSYNQDIPYYNIRTIIKPGLSGWAQINHQSHPHHELNREETRNKLSYDFYYIKNRSLVLDVKIALRTIKILLQFVGK